MAPGDLPGGGTTGPGSDNKGISAGSAASLDQTVMGTASCEGETFATAMSTVDCQLSTSFLSFFVHARDGIVTFRT